MSIILFVIYFNYQELTNSVHMKANHVIQAIKRIATNSRLVTDLVQIV